MLEFLYGPAESVDASLARLLEGGSLPLILLVALLLGLRHALDPDHLAATTSLVAGGRGGVGRAASLGAWWGVGHAGILLVIGIPLILLGAALPAWLEGSAEKAIGVVIAALGARVVWRWARGGYRSGAHSHGDARHAHVWAQARPEHAHGGRTGAQAFGIGALHGLAGTGAVVLLLLAALPGEAEAVAALALFAPASALSMTACTAGFTAALTSRRVEPLYRAVALPAMGLAAMLFGVAFMAG